MSIQPKRISWLWPLLLMVGGMLLLLDNLLLIDVDLIPYWPLLLVPLGLQLLLRGDIAFGWQAHTFGITRGSVESASLEVESGELDVQVRALHKPGRLIAGQYTARSRPSLIVRNNQATLRMQRGQTWWLSLADWDVGLARDLPWSLLVSSYLGRLEADLRGLQIDRAYVSSGIGTTTIYCPPQAAGPVFARSTFGDVQLWVPEDSLAIITVKASPFARVRVDWSRFEQIADNTYRTILPDEYLIDDADTVDLAVTVGTVFGSIYIR
jgi:hypothetical protein